MLLHVYDADDWLTRITGEMRNADESAGVTGGMKGVIRELDQLVSDSKYFDSAVIA